MRAYLRLVRIGNTLTSFVGTVVGGVAAVGWGGVHGVAFALPVGLAAASTACVTAGGNVLNDYLDRESDKVNHPDRPLVTGVVRPVVAKRLAVGLFVAAALLVAPIAFAAPFVALILAVALAALLGYELKLKARGFVGNLTVALLTGLVFLYGGAAVDSFAAVEAFAAMAFLATLSREVIKDMEDVSGDTDRRTLPMTLGLTGAARVAAGSAIAAIALSVLPLFTFLSLGSRAGIIYLALVGAADGLFVASIAYLPRRLHTEQTVSKGGMTVALLAFLSAAFR